MLKNPIYYAMLGLLACSSAWATPIVYVTLTNNTGQPLYVKYVSQNNVHNQHIWYWINNGSKHKFANSSFSVPASKEPFTIGFDTVGGEGSLTINILSKNNKKPIISNLKITYNGGPNSFHDPIYQIRFQYSQQYGYKVSGQSFQNTYTFFGTLEKN